MFFYILLLQFTNLGCQTLFTGSRDHVDIFKCVFQPSPEEPKTEPPTAAPTWSTEMGKSFNSGQKPHQKIFTNCLYLI